MTGAPDPELSVVIVSYRCAGLLADCLQSLAANRGDVSMEVEVIDNASGDDTIEVARAAGWVVATELDENVGFARANNCGLARTTGRAVLVLNPDTVVPPHGLRRCLDELWSHPDVGLLTARLIDPDGRLDRRCKRGFPTLWSSLCYFTGLDQVLRDRRSLRYTVGWLPDTQAGDVESVSGAFMLMRRDALHEVGGFDAQFFMYAEDMDLSLRFVEHGWRVRYWPGVDVIHVGAGSNVNGKRPPLANAAYFRTMAPFIFKHRPGWRGRALGAFVGLVGELLLALSQIAGGLRVTPRGSRVSGESEPLAVSAPGASRSLRRPVSIRGRRAAPARRQTPTRR
jgi:GT2 family glycosyltransferase